MAEQFTPTITPTATGGAQAVAEIGKHQTRANAWDTAFGVFKQAAQTTQVLTEEEQRRQTATDTVEAYRDAVDASVGISQMPLADQEAAYRGIIDSISTGSSDRSDTYNKTLLNSIMPKYSSAATENKKQLTAIDIRMSTDSSVLQSVNEGSFGDTAATIKATADRLNVDVASVRDSYYGSFYGYYNDKISGISDNDELNLVLQEMKGAEATLNSPQLMGNSSTGESGTYLAGQKSRFAGTLTSTRAAIVKNNRLIIQDTENKNDPNPRGRYTQHPSINKSKYPDSVAYKEAIQNYESHSSNVQQANNYDTEVSSSFNSLDIGAQDIVKKDITTSIVNNFDDFDREVLANTLISQKQNSNDGINHIKANLYSQNDEQSAVAFMKIQKLRNQPNGEEALNVIFKNEDERNKYDAIVAIQEAGIVGSMYEANKFINQPTVPWKFATRSEEGSYNSKFEKLPVAISNRGREVYKMLRSHGVDHSTAIDAGVKAVEAKSNIGGIEIYGTKQLVQAGEKVQRSIATHLTAMTESLGTEITHSYDMWSDNVVSYNEYGIIVDTTNKQELIELATTQEAFKRDSKEHWVSERFERGIDNINTFIQKRVLRGGSSITSTDGAPAYYDTPDKLYNFFRNTYTIGKGVRRDGKRITGNE